MRISENEILLYYDPATSIGRKTRAYAHSLSTNINDVEYHKTKFTSTTWRQILDMLRLEPKKLLDKSHPYYQSHIRGRSYDDEGWLNILIRNPELIIAPIAIKGNRAILCTNPTDIYRLLQMPVSETA